VIFLTLDFESYFGKKYNLKKMPMSLYVQDEQFEVLSCSIKTQDMAEPYFAFGPKKVAKLMKWCREHQDEIVLCCHHSQFDGYIAAYHYGFKPKMHVCTMSMSQQLHSHDGPVSLDAISKLYDAPQPKIKMPNIQSKCWHDLTPEETDALKVYNNTDVMATEWIAKHQLQHFPKNELWIIDRTIRMFTEGAMVINTEKAKAVMDAEYKTKLGLARQAKASQEELRSNDKFAALLESRGFEVPTKWSEKQDKYVPAFAQADLPFQAMRDSDDPELALLVKARLANKTSINETRAKAMLARSNAPVPVYLKAYAAHTMRPGGGDRFNPLNLPRDGRLRECLEAPEGHVFVICDASQIEARDNATFSGQDDLVQAFREGRDVYSEFASELYGFEVSKETAPTERFVGKTSILGLGYQMGAMKFQLTLETGMMGPPIEFSFEQAQQAVNTYRSKYRKIKQTWHELQSRIPFLMPSCKREEHWRGLIFRPGEVVMPNGLSLHYPGLDYEIGRFDSAEFYYTPYDHKYKKRVRNKLYGGLLLENITQCKSWLMTSDHMRQLSRYYKVVLAVYDEIVMCVPISKAEQCLKDTIEIMSIPPAWNENCPLAAEGEISKFYTKP